MNLGDSVNVEPVFIELVDKLDFETVKKKVESLGYNIDMSYNSHKFKRGIKETIAYRILIPKNSKQDAFEELKNCPFLFGLWSDERLMLDYDPI